MTFINVTTTQAEITITEENGAITAITTPASPGVITAYTEGPQGAPGAAIASIGQIPDVDTSAVSDGSVLVYDSSSSKFKANNVWTTSTLSDGGNF
jgi:hypothetical protein